MNLKKISKAEKRELQLSKNPLRKLRADLWSQGMTLESFLETCYNCDLNPLPMLRQKGIDVRYFKDTSYCDVSVSHDEKGRVILFYPDFDSNWNEWCRFNDRYHELLNLAEELRNRRSGLNRPHRVIKR